MKRRPDAPRDKHPPDTGTTEQTRCGYVAIVGRPNVGKSTLLNRILGQKLSITSRKPQTTRHRLLGIKTRGQCQTLYVDTPGLHRKIPREINRYMNRSAMQAMAGVDLIVFLVDRLLWTDDDEWVLARLIEQETPVLLAINKVDLVPDKRDLLGHLERLSKLHDFLAMIPVSAADGHNIERLESLIESRLPLGVHLFPEDQLTDRPVRFLVAEMIREKIMRQLGAEIPYEVTVQVERFVESDQLIEVLALVLVERDGQKAILIGKNGARLKLIGSEARKSMEAMLGTKVMLRLWVKVRSGWSDDERALRSLGYEDV